MDHDSTKDGAADGDRRNWRERLGVGQDLPKISDEFGPPKPQEGEQSAAPSGAKPGTPVARPAPMAPRYARPAAPKPANGSSSGDETKTVNSPESTGNQTAIPGLNAWAAPSTPSSSPESPAAPNRASAYPQAARPSGAGPASTGESFGERLRAQREAAEKLAQQRLAAARERSLRGSADALTILAPQKPAAKPATGDQPRFTFAQEEIVAARQETAFAPHPPSDPAPKADAPMAPDEGFHTPGAPEQPTPDEPQLYSEPPRRAADTPDYRHEDDTMFDDDGMFEEGQPTLQAAPPRASAADYSAAYREFEDEFEEEPRRRSGPLLVLASLAALAVVSGGAIFWYQQGGEGQLESAPPAAEATNLPVITAPEEPAKSEPPPQEPQEAAAPTTRKEIYDRIIGEETLEPERIVPTEEAPLREIQQPGASEAGRETGSGEPLPLPLPPPPGTGIGEQGDLLVPGAANVQRASAEPQREPQAEPEPEPELALPEPRGAQDGETSVAAKLEPDTQTAAARSAAIKLRGTAAATETTEAAREETRKAAAEPASSRSSIYPEVTEPLAYPTLRSADQTAALSEARETLQAEPDAEAETAPVAERAAAPEPEPAEPEVADAEPDSELAADVPLPKVKPEPPVRVARAPEPAPEPEPQQRQAPEPSSSGPIQIIPTDESQAPIARAVQPEAQATPQRRRTVGREPDPLARPGSTFASNLSELNVSPPQQQQQQQQQLASVAPDASTQPQPAPAQPTQADPAGGYLVQLASFRTEAEALKAYEVLAQRHPQLVGDLGSRVREASLGQTGSFWRLGVGPLSNRTEASRLCNALIAAGEKDCLVRRN